MCYSSKIEAGYKRYVREFGGRISMHDYYQLVWERSDGRKVKVPRALEDAFLADDALLEPRIAELILSHRAAEATRLEQELFGPRTRLAEAQRKLSVKHTKSAADSARIATKKTEQILGWLSDLRRPAAQAGDARIYPGTYAHVMLVEHGERVLRPMRYGCRPAGKPASYDSKYPGTYNARRDNLVGFWRGQFGHTHGVAFWWTFYEHVERNGQDVVLEFAPSTGELMAVACLYSHWTPPPDSHEPDLWSFAAVTDDPPPEVAAAGHDRCVIPLRAVSPTAVIEPPMFAVLEPATGG